MKLFLTEDKNILETIVDIRYKHFDRHLQKVVRLNNGFIKVHIYVVDYST